LKSKDYYVDINCNVQLGEVDEEVKPEGEAETEEEKLNVVPTAPHSVYKTRVEFSDVPDDVEFREELEGLCAGDRLAGKLPILHVKASYDSFDLLIASKEKELLQLTEAYEEAELTLQEAEEAQAALNGRTASPKHTSAPSTPAAAHKDEGKVEEPVEGEEEVVEEAGRVEELFDEATSDKQAEAPASPTPASEPAAPTPTPAPAAAKESTTKPATKKATTAKKSTEKKSTKKTSSKKKATVAKDVDEEDVDEEEEEKKGGTVAKKSLVSSWSAAIANLAQQCLGLGFQHRNWFIFGLTAFGIYAYGDYASV